MESHSATTTRGEMAVFLLRTRFGPSYAPPPCTNATFSDVPCSNLFAAWIYDLVNRGVTAELVRRGVTGGCGGGNYCPTAAVTRDQMAIFLVAMFGLVPI